MPFTNFFMKKNIALLAGGYSGEFEVSMNSANTVQKHLDAQLYEVYKIVITKKDWTYTGASGENIPVDKNDFSLTINGEKIKFDAAFIIIHGTPGEDGLLQGYLDMLDIPYTNCGLMSSALTFNKSYCNKVVAALDIIHVAKSAHLFKGKAYDTASILQALELPLFVKPAGGGSSIGMTKVKTAEELPGAIERAFREDVQVLVEEFMSGREFSCGAFTEQGAVKVLPITEIISKKEFFDYEAKYTPGMSEEVTPANVPPAMAAKAQGIIAKLYDALNCKGMVRIDFIWDESKDKLYFLEVNTTPGQSEASIIPQQVRAAGMNLGQFYGNLIEECLRKS